MSIQEARTLDPQPMKDEHFDPKGKMPSSFTIELQNGLRQSLPFEDKRDFAEAKKGFIAAPPYKQIMADAGNVAWDMGSYEFLLRGFDSVFDSIHPSLQRQAVLNMAYGLYEVVPDTIYQVRGFDLANMTIIKGDTGWILFDVLTCKETARAALALVNEHLGERPVVAVVYSHSHVDHFGGVRGVVDEADVKSGKVQVIAPIGFNVYKLPESLQQQWAAHSYHGSEEHNSRAVINRYLGYWDANPATLVPLSPHESAPLYVEMMGGAEKIITEGTELYNQGKYREAMEILNKLVYAEPQNQPAKDLLADVFEQIGYQKESPSVRNSFLAAAYELRNSFPSGVTAQSVNPDTVRAMSTELLLDFVAIRVDSQQATGMKFTINLVTSGNGEQFAVEMSNSTLTNIKGFLAKNPDLTITINRNDLELVMAGITTFPALIQEGKAKLEGSPEPVMQLRSILVEFTPDFAIMPGTKPQKTTIASDKDAFEQPQPADTSGG